ncbi:galactose oxidase [Gigaspora margarita]|uniref:Galactose oxidase n=1 Tax=Gigaspora margarita TaxID=4874 RepID=A0A8H4EP66_GIGMA|nr:galactose oxidase [Gigaspora margarita]
MNLIQSIFNFFLTLSFVNLFVICDDVPSPRDAQTSSLVNNKLYFFGGSSVDNFTNHVWYLDLSNSFNVSVPPLYKGQEMLFAVSFASSCVSPIDNSSVFLIGGNMSLADNASVPFYPFEVYIFDSKMSYWRPANIIGYNNSYTARYSMQAVIDNDGKIFMFGGGDSNVTNVNITKNAWYNDMHMLDTTTMKWSTLLLCCFDIKMVRLFNTKSFTWSNKQTIGASIDNRGRHTAVLTQNGSIIIYGGSTINITQVSPNLAVLDINTWEWSIPNISQKNVPPSLVYHSATIFGNYMIVSFGQILLQLSPATISYIYILDIRNYTWVTVATINNLEAIPIPTNPSSSTYTLIIVVTSFVGIILIGSVITGIFIYKKRQEHRHSIATHGTLLKFENLKFVIICI